MTAEDVALSMSTAGRRAGPVATVIVGAVGIAASGVGKRHSRAEAEDEVDELHGEEGCWMNEVDEYLGDNERRAMICCRREGSLPVKAKLLMARVRMTVGERAILHSYRRREPFI
jgi:hypothetical protein